MTRVPRLRWLALGLLILIGALAGCFAAAVTLEENLVSLAATSSASHGPALWHHRGPAGSAAYAGVELDVRWVAGRGLLVSHDPIETQERPFTLGAVLGRGDLPRHVWLDFKALDNATAKTAAPELAALVETHAGGHQYYLEAIDLEALVILRRAAPSLRPVARATFWRRLRPLPGYLCFLRGLLQHRIDAVSMPSEALDSGLARHLEPLFLMAFTTNDPAEISRLASLGVDVVLTDTLPPR